MFGLLSAVVPTKFFSVDEILGPYIYVFYASFIISFVFTPIMRMVAVYYGIVDQPDRLRKMHSEPVAYLGGVAVFLGWMAGLATSQFTGLHRLEMRGHLYIPMSIIVGASVVTLLGLWDDIKSVKPRVKILLQVGAAGFLLFNDVGTRCTEQLFGPIMVRLEHWLHWVPDKMLYANFIAITSSLLVIFVVVGCCNATNLMDGLDGLCGGVTAVIAAGFLFVAIHLAMYGPTVNTNWDALRVVLGLALLGAVLGFIPYNFNPASIFMGDTGSMFLGFACATMIILFAQQEPKWFLASMVMFALPVMDTSLAFARRWVNRRPFFSPDRQHFHHQLVARGFSVKQTVMISYGLALAFALLGVAIVFMRTRYAVAFYLVIFGSIIVAAYKMGMVHEKPRVVTRPQQLSSLSPDDSASTQGEPGNVIELPDPAERDKAIIARPAISSPGVWNEPA